MFSHRLNLIIYLDITIYLLIKWFSDKLILTTVLNKSLFEWNSQASTLRLNHQIIYTLAMERIELILRWRKYSEFQSFRWALVGVFTNSLDYVIFLLIFYRFNSILIANFISTLIATLTIRFKPDTDTALGSYFVPLLLLAVPILDTSIAIFSRIRRGTSPFQGGQDHMSHRLIRSGVSRKKSVFILWALSFAYSFLAVAVGRFNLSNENFLISLASFSWLLLLILFLKTKND